MIPSLLVMEKYIIYRCRTERGWIIFSAAVIATIGTDFPSLDTMNYGRKNGSA
jgi:hypothetical protein